MTTALESQQPYGVPGATLERISRREPVSRVESGEVGQVMIYAAEGRQVLVRDEGGPGWLEEIRKRVADVDAGNVELIDAATAIRAMRARIAAASQR